MSEDSGAFGFYLSMTFPPLGDTLHDQKKSSDHSKQKDDSIEVLEITKKILTEMFGQDLAIDANPLFLKNRTLTISCSSSAIAQQIRENQLQIVEKINGILGEKLIDRIRYLA